MGAGGRSNQPAKRWPLGQGAPLALLALQGTNGVSVGHAQGQLLSTVIPTSPSPSRRPGTLEGCIEWRGGLALVHSLSGCLTSWQTHGWRLESML